MQTIENAAWMVAGMIVYHQPSKRYYKLLNRTMIKGDKTSGKSWEYGWSYIQTNAPSDIVFSRPDSLFDSDWLLVG